MISILVVDDTPVNVILLTCLLETNPDNFILEAVNGLEAINVIKSNRVDIVLMDVDMPIMNGLDATKYIKSNISKDLPIIAVTAHMSHEIKTWEDVGFNEIISKPIDKDQILSALKKYTNKNK